VPIDGPVLCEGPLFRAGRALGLVGHDGRSVPLGLAIGGSLWLVLVLLAVAEGVGDTLFSPAAIGVHVRLLLAVPLLFVAETLLAPRLGTFVETIVRNGVVAPADEPALRVEVSRLRRATASWLPETACLLGAMAMIWAGSHLHLYGTTASLDAQRSAAAGTLAGQWYGVVCLTVVRFLLLRWLWRILLWCRFLHRLCRLDLHLVPIHPDRQGGLGYVQVVQAQFMPVVAAASAIQAAGLAEEIHGGMLQFEAVAPAIALVLVVLVAVFLGPLLILAPRLRRARLDGLDAYMGLASRYVGDFEAKWLVAGGSAGEPFLGSPDLGSLADMQSGFGMVEAIRWFPVSFRLALLCVAATLVPMAPLLLLKYPIAELAGKLVGRLVGS